MQEFLQQENRVLISRGSPQPAGWQQDSLIQASEDS